MDQVIEFVGNHALLAGGFGAVLVLLVYTEVMRLVRGLKELSPAQAVPWINDPDAVVIDVSAAADFQKGHIVDARNLPAARLAKPDAEILKLKDKKLLLVCKSGQSAPPAAISLLKMGVSNVAVLKGGMVQWRNDQFPVTTK
jgi:rhodanese-related sulfurtransferase